MFGGPGFILAIIAMAMLGWVITTAIRAKHGYPITDDWGNTVRRDGGDPRELISENKALTSQVERLEARLAVLERIATDPGQRLSNEIDRLRDDEG